MKRVEEKNARKLRRKKHIRKRISGTAQKPRITVFKSNKYVYVQAIDDLEGKTLVSLNNLSSDMKSLNNNIDGAAKLGEARRQGPLSQLRAGRHLESAQSAADDDGLHPGVRQDHAQ